MLRQIVAVGFAVSFGSAFARDPGCGGVDSPSGSVNAPCTRDKDCKGGLACVQGVCADSDAAPAGDAGHDGA